MRLIQKLRIKFICIMMVIAALMVGSILWLVVFFTGQIMEMQSYNMMRTLVSAPYQRGDLQNRSEEVRLPYFTVQVNFRGKITSVSGGYFDLSDETNIQQIVDAALSGEGETGKLEEYGLRYLKGHSPKGLTIVFADTATETATIREIMDGSAFLFTVAMVLFFFISLWLSQWAIKPVAVAWKQQRQFVADASHELKTPLSVIMTNAELMQSEETTAEDCRKFSQNILTMSYQMRTLVEKLLEMARVDNGREQMKFAPVEFSELVGDAVLSFQLLYEEQGMGLQCNVREHLTIKGSEQHLYQVLDVLLDNALKYAEPRSTVMVKLYAVGRDCVLSVASCGAPMSKEELKNIFKRFYRGDKVRSMNGSYGLGLSIAEAIVEAHKGKIWAESAGGVNTFFVQLPMN